MASFFKKIVRCFKYPSSLPRSYREMRDSRQKSRRIENARRLLDSNGVLELLTPGDDSEIAPSLSDLANLYQLVRDRKPRVVLELGIGFSTIVIAEALRQNLSKHKVPGHLFTVDAQESWIENTRAKIPENLRDFVTIQFSTISVRLIEGTLCHAYDSLPDVSPNFIYVDGPEGVEVGGDINGLGFTRGRSVISIEPLLYESTAPLDYFVLVDGRWETCRFLSVHLKGKYRHQQSVSRKFGTFEYLSREYF